MPTTPARPTAERILDAAERQFAERGYDGTSLSEIAQQVGIRTPSLYKHFSNKRALYEAVMARLLDPYFETLDHVLQQPTEAGHADRNLSAIIDHYWNAPNLARLVQHAALAGGEQLQLIVDRWYRPLMQRAARYSEVPRVGAEDAMALTLAFHAMMSGYVTLAPLHGALLGQDPMGEPARESQARLMRRLATAFFK